MARQTIKQIYQNLTETQEVEDLKEFSFLNTPDDLVNELNKKTSHNSMLDIDETQFLIKILSSMSSEDFKRFQSLRTLSEMNKFVYGLARNADNDTAAISDFKKIANWLFINKQINGNLLLKLIDKLTPNSFPKERRKTNFKKMIAGVGSFLTEDEDILTED